MVIFPAIDIRGGKCVRLFKGDFAQETVFSDKPEDMAVKWQQQGGKFLHLVDLDGALAGKSQNLEVVKRIIASVDIPVELGGGIRTMENIDEVLALGVRRVILGSVAVQNPELVKEACDKYGDRIVVDQMLPYIVAQLLGAALGATLVWLVYKDHFDATADADTKLGGQNEPLCRIDKRL